MINVALYVNDKVHMKPLVSQLISDADREDVRVVAYYDTQNMIKDIEKSGSYYDVVVMDTDYCNMELCLKDVTQIKQLNPICHILFVSSVSANEAVLYEMNHICCMNKNEVNKCLGAAVKKTSDFLDDVRNMRLEIYSRNKLTILNQYDILYIERKGRNTLVTCDNHNYSDLDDDNHDKIRAKNDKCESDKKIVEFIISDKLEDLHNRLIKDMFIRCHESFLVNLHNITRYEKKKVFIINNKIVPISRKYAIEVHEKVLDFFNQDTVKGIYNE